MDIKKYIFPITSSQNDEGCGFFVGDLFFTSGHLLEEAEVPLFIIVKGEKIYLENPIISRYDKTTDGYDLAVFKIPSINSPLQFVEDMPKPGTELTSLSFKFLGAELIECKATVEAIENKYFDTLTSYNLKAGSSGSPVFDGDKVAGVMTRGNNDGCGNPCNPEFSINACCFLSSKSILELL